MSRTALGAASLLPALAVLALSAFEGVLLRAAEAGTAPPAAVAVACVVVMAGALAAVLTFMVQAVGEPGRGGVWKLAWVVTLGAAGVLAAPAFWVLHVRRRGTAGQGGVPR